MFDREKSDAIFTETLNLLDTLNTRDGRFEYADYVALHNNITALYDSFADVDEELQELAKAEAEGRLVERGTWINGYCSNCNSPIPTDNKDDYIAKNECRFCYYCGAKMEEAAEKALEVGE